MCGVVKVMCLDWLRTCILDWQRHMVSTLSLAFPSVYPPIPPYPGKTLINTSELWQQWHYWANQPTQCTHTPLGHPPGWLSYFFSHTAQHSTTASLLLHLSPCMQPSGQTAWLPPYPARMSQYQLWCLCCKVATTPSRPHTNPTSPDTSRAPPLMFGQSSDNATPTTKLFKTRPQVIPTSNTCLQTKLEWTTNPATTVHWTIIQYALWKFSSAEHRILSKFNHEWLPLQDWHHIQSLTPYNCCPSCWQHPKTPAHFLACTHQEQVQIWKEFHKQLHQHQISNNISNIFHDIMAYGLYMGHQALHTIQLHHLPPDI